MDFSELCQHRQSCRDFTGQPVEHEKLVNCVEAARMAPSGCNSQPWRFVVVETPGLVQEVSKCTMQMGINEYTSKAGAFIVVMEEHAVLMPSLRKILDSQYFAKGDVGAASISICLAAAEQGLGTCILGIFDREKLCQVLDIPAEKRISVVIAVGYPSSDKIRPKIRKPLEEIARFT